MKSIWLALAFLAVTFLTGCTTAPPKPVNANGTVSPTVALGEADLAFQNADNNVTVYITQCHAAPTTPGCNETLITNMKAASAKALKALQAAHHAVGTLPVGATGIDAAIGDLQSALAFLESFTGQIPKSMLTGAHS